MSIETSVVLVTNILRSIIFCCLQKNVFNRMKQQKKVHFKKVHKILNELNDKITHIMTWTLLMLNSFDHFFPSSCVLPVLVQFVCFLRNHSEVPLKLRAGQCHIQVKPIGYTRTQIFTSKILVLLQWRVSCRVHFPPNES